ncbi:unnamed protein product [Symbiodinium sp. CCMP2592]|nr:unnamed protein product [Symbiodinium sp. CCMP2592]
MGAMIAATFAAVTSSQSVPSQAFSPTISPLRQRDFDVALTSSRAKHNQTLGCIGDQSDSHRPGGARELLCTLRLEDERRNGCTCSNFPRHTTAILRDSFLVDRKRFSKASGSKTPNLQRPMSGTQTSECLLTASVTGSGFLAPS